LKKKRAKRADEQGTGRRPGIKEGGHRLYEMDIAQEK